MLVEEKRFADRVEWVINDPKNGNSLGMKVYDRLHGLLCNLEKECQKNILVSSGGKAQIRLLVIKAKPVGNARKPIWIAGGNLKELASYSREHAKEYAKKYSSLCHRLMDLPIPVLMAIDGQVIGGGVEFALFGDIRYATVSTTFSFKQLKVGLALGYGSSNRLAHLVGPACAMDYMLSQKVIFTDELMARGLVQKEFPSFVELDMAIAAFSECLSKLEPLAVGMQKRMFNRTYLAASPAQIQADIDDFSNLWKNPSHMKFLEHFLQGER